MGEGGGKAQGKTAREEKQNRFLGNGIASNKEQADVVRAE